MSLNTTLADISHIKSEISNEKDASKLDNFEKEKQNLIWKNELHKRKGQKFYEVKRAARLKSRKSEYKEAICMDFQKNYQFQTFQLLRAIIVDSCPFILVTYIRCQQEDMYDQNI